VNGALAAQEWRVLRFFLDDPAGMVPAGEEAKANFFEKVLR
jgi:hypothetical protein